MDQCRSVCRIPGTLEEKIAPSLRYHALVVLGLDGEARFNHSSHSLIFLPCMASEQPRHRHNFLGPSQNSVARF